MGNDGGSIPDRRDLVRSKPKAEQADKQNQARARWFFCALSKARLREPVVACALGKLYNKDALLEYLLDRTAYGDGATICGHIRSLKDVTTLTLTPNPAHTPDADGGAADEHATPRPQWVCPLTFKEMNGAVPFGFLPACGCVFSLAGLKAVTGGAKGKEKAVAPADGAAADGSAGPADDARELCPQCGAKFAPGAVRTLNPSEDEEERMLAAMLAARALEPAKKGKKRKAGAAADLASAGDSAPAAKKARAPVPSSNPSIAAASRAVVAGLAMEEAKRHAGMSEAVKSLYADKDAPKRKETFMTMGTFTRYA